LTMIYDNLVSFDTNLKMQPALAESWDHPDPLTWRFNIRKGVKFTDGTPLNAAAVKSSYDRASKQAPVAPSFVNVGAINAPGEFVVELKMKAPCADFLS